MVIYFFVCFFRIYQTNLFSWCRTKLAVLLTEFKQFLEKALIYKLSFSMKFDAKLLSVTKPWYFTFLCMLINIRISRRKKINDFSVNQATGFWQKKQGKWILVSWFDSGFRWSTFGKGDISPEPAIIPPMFGNGVARLRALYRACYTPSTLIKDLN